MFKARNKKFSLLMALVFAFTVIMPVGAAFAGSDVEFSNAVQKGIDDGTDTELGWIKIDLDEDTVPQDVYIYVTVELPDDVDWLVAPDDSTQNPPLSDYIQATANSGGTVTMATYVGDPDKDDLTAKFYANGGIDYIKVKFDTANSKVHVANGFEGDINVDVTVRAIDGGFELWDEPYTYTATVGKTGDNEITVRAADPKAMSSGSNKKGAKIYLEEAFKGAFSTTDVVYLEIVNDDDFAFSNVTVKDGKYGLTATASKVSDSKWKIDIDTASDSFADTLEITPYVDVFPFASGDVEIEVYCDTNPDFEDATVTVGTIGDNDITVVAKGSADDIYPATLSQSGTDMEIADIEITGASDFEDGDEFILTLPKGFEWKQQDDFAGFDEKGLFNDNRSLWYVVNGLNDDEFTFEDLQIQTGADAPLGDIVVEITGDYEASVVVGECKARAEFTADVAEVQVGLEQAAGNITITETEDDALENGKIIRLELPKGVTFSGKPTVEVNGDELGSSKITLDNDEEWVEIELDDLHTGQIDTIVISDIEYDIDSRVVGDIKVEVLGDAINGLGTTEINDTDEDDAVLTVVNATVVDAKTVAASFTVGDEGVYVENGRTLVQVNLLTDVLGLQKTWDAAAKTAYFIKDGKVVAFPIGENKIFINGVEVPVDQGAKIINNYTCVTLRGLQMAFGGDLKWDSVTKTATFNFVK